MTTINNCSIERLIVYVNSIKDDSVELVQNIETSTKEFRKSFRLRRVSAFT